MMSTTGVNTGWNWRVNFTPFLFLKSFFIFLFLAVLGLQCYAGFPLVASGGGYSLAAAASLLAAAASPDAEHRLEAGGLQ